MLLGFCKVFKLLFPEKHTQSRLHRDIVGEKTREREFRKRGEGSKRAVIKENLGTE